MGAERTSASSPLKLNKNVATPGAQPKAQKAGLPRQRKLQGPHLSQEGCDSEGALEKIPKKVKSPVAAGAKEVSESPKKAKPTAPLKKAAQRPAKAQAGKPRVLKSKAAKVMKVTSKIKWEVGAEEANLFLIYFTYITASSSTHVITNGKTLPL